MVIRICLVCGQYKEKVSNGICPACYMIIYRRDGNDKKLQYKGKCDECGKIKDDIHRGLCQSCYRTKYNKEQQLLAPLKKCQCRPECPEMIPSINMHGKPMKYKEGHSKRGRNNNLYKRGWFIRDEYKFLTGYYDHPNANSKGEIREHVLVMSNHLNRPLFKGEIVHHINKNKLDNRIENLSLTNRSKHQNTHNPRKGYKKDYTGVTCIECGSDKTAKDSRSGNPHWCRHPITKEEYVCEQCYKNIRYRNKIQISYRRVDTTGRICVKCGAQSSVDAVGKSTWHGLGDGSSYECKKCYDSKRDYKKEWLKRKSKKKSN